MMQNNFEIIFWVPNISQILFTIVISYQNRLNRSNMKLVCFFRVVFYLLGSIHLTLENK